MGNNVKNLNEIYLNVPEISAISCLTPLQQPGQCIIIKSCPILLDVLRYQRQAAGDFLRRSVCKFEGKNPIVCCPTIDTKNEYSDINSNMNTEKVSHDGATNYGPLYPPQCGFSNVSYSRVVGGVPAELGNHYTYVMYLINNRST